MCQHLRVTQLIVLNMEASSTSIGSKTPKLQPVARRLETLCLIWA